MATAPSTLAAQTAQTAQTARSSSSAAPLRRLLVVIGSVIAVGLVGGGAFTIADLASHHTFAVHASYAGVRSLVVDDHDGGVALTRGSAGTRLTVTEQVSEGLTSPTRTAAVADGVLRLVARCPGFGIRCGVAYSVAVPPGIPISASTGSGNLTASDLAGAGAVTLTTGSGDIHASDVSSRASVSLASGDGDLTADQVTAPRIRLSTGDGDLSATLGALPAGGTLNLSASSGDGDIVLGVPAGAYAVHAASGDGSVSDQALRVDPGSPLRIDASAGDGDVTIAPRG
jgi:putative adhesin